MPTEADNKIAVATERLIALTKSWLGGDEVPTAQQIECRIIGKRLHMLGGIVAMDKAFVKAKERNYRCGNIRLYWEGIG